MAKPQREIAIVGAGLMGRWHAATAHRLGARIVAVVDPDPARAAPLAARHGARTFADLGSLLQATHPSVAHVCSPLASHAAGCEALLAAGCHVICEKPVATTAAEVERLLHLAECAGRRFAAVHQFAMQRGAVAVRSRLGSLAPLGRIDFDICTAGAADRALHRRDGLVLDALPHPLSVLHSWLPDQELATARWHVHHPAGGELLATAEVAGAVVSIGISCSARPTAAAACVRGGGGTAHVDFFHGHASFQGASVSRRRKILQPFARSGGEALSAGTNLLRRIASWEPAYPGLRELVRACYRHCDGSGPPPMTGAAVLDVYRARDAIALAMGPTP